jgi:hypothetical protein
MGIYMVDEIGFGRQFLGTTALEASSRMDRDFPWPHNRVLFIYVASISDEHLIYLYMYLAEYIRYARAC